MDSSNAPSRRSPLLRRTVGRFSSRTRAALAPERVRSTLRGYYMTVDGVLANRRAVVLVGPLPLPDGLGGFEAAAAAALSVLGDLGLPTAAAAVFRYRLSNHWFVVLLGGAASLSLSLRSGDSAAVPPLEDDDRP